ncbi:hypothetical protein [Methylophilus methylotrophus]|uniref:hypothetical protein n=1 Tax=Methylophilus methylotrophus TaxID=17 RepID=UPI0013DDD406|nr:hypothetical protein [Methylophilus methylotrophus]
MNAAIWGLIGTLVGAITSIATTWIASRNNIHLQIVVGNKLLESIGTVLRKHY